MNKAGKKEKKDQNPALVDKKSTNKGKKVEEDSPKKPAIKELESNWSYYKEIDETDNISSQDNLNYKSLLEDSYEYSKYKLFKDKSESNEEKTFSNDILTLDLNKLNLMIKCEPFNSTFLNELNPDDYLNEKIIETFQSKSKLAIEQLNKLIELETQKKDSNNVRNEEKKVEKIIDIIPKEENKEMQQQQLVIPATKPQAIEDWLDDLIIE